MKNFVCVLITKYVNLQKNFKKAFLSNKYEIKHF